MGWISECAVESRLGRIQPFLKFSPHNIVEATKSQRGFSQFPLKTNVQSRWSNALTWRNGLEDKMQREQLTGTNSSAPLRGFLNRENVGCERIVFIRLQDF